MAKIKPKEAVEFLKHFGYTNVTIATIQEPDAPTKAFNFKHFKSTKYSNNGKPKIAHTFPLRDFDSDLVTELAKLQKMKRAVYFLVNESDGKTDSENPNANRNHNILHLNACFCDTDGCPPNRVVKWLNELKVKPHLVVETSPKKYHFYFKIEPAPLKEKAKWVAIQKCMGWLGDLEVDHGMDKTMHDITQLMRLPGFLHQKKEPFPIRVVKVNYHDPYTLDELFYKFKAEQFYHTPERTKVYELPSNKITAGERHEAFRNFALSEANKRIGDPDAAQRTLVAVDGFMVSYFEKPAPFLQGGSRRKEVLRTVEDAVNLANESLISNLPPINYEDLEESDDNSFALPDTFYYHAPGIVGEIVKHICNNARYPVPAFAFASTVALLGTLKSPYLTSEMGHAPANYFLCLAPTGAGKNYPQEVLAHTLTDLGVPDLAASKVRSARGIETFLEHHNSNGLLALDEAENLLASLSEGGTPHHIRSTKELLLELYSKTNTPHYNTGWLGDKKQTPTVLEYPRLNLVAYGVVHTLEEAFTVKSIKDGLLQRFIVLTHMKKRNRNKNATPAAALNSHFAASMREMILESRITTLEGLEELEKLKTAYTACDDDKERKRLKAKVEKLKERAGNPERKVLPFKIDAMDLLEKYSDKMDDCAHRELKAERGFEGLYTRGAEQVGRLATAITQEQYVNKDLVQYCIDLIDSRVEALRDYAWQNLGVSNYNFQKEKLYKSICRRYVKVQQPVTYRHMARSFTAAINRKHFRDLIDGLYDDGRIRMVNPPSSGGRGKTGETFIPAPIDEEEY